MRGYCIVNALVTLNTRVVVINSLLSALGQCFSSGLLSLFIRLCGKFWGRYNFKDEKVSSWVIQMLGK